jgi:hypothetical protein
VAAYVEIREAGSRTAYLTPERSSQGAALKEGAALEDSSVQEAHEWSRPVRWTDLSLLTAKNAAARRKDSGENIGTGVIR